MYKLFTIILVTLIFIFLFLGFFHPITAITQDLGRHFLLGKIILQTHHIPTTNFFSYTYPNFPFVDTDWLSSVVFYLVFTVTSYSGLLLLTTLFMLAGFALLFFYRFKTKNIFALCLISLLYINILFERTDVRPEIFSFFFLSIFIAVLYYYREHKTRFIILLPFLELLWVNLHIYFIIGIAVSGLFFLDNVIVKFKKRKDLFSSDTIILGTVLAISALITFINPNFISGALYPFRVFKNYGYPIEENQSLFFLWQYFQAPTASMVAFSLSALLLFTSLFLTLKKTKPIDWMLAIFFTVFAVTAIRNIPLFAIATFIPAVSSLSIIINKLLPIKKPPKLFIICYSLFAVLFVWQIVNRINTTPPGFGVATGAKNAMDFFQEENLQGPIFNNFDIGSYIEYRLYPKVPTFVDGRPEAYPTAFFQNVYIPMQQDPALFKAAEQRYRFNTIVFSYTDQTPWARSFLSSIVNNKNWSLIYLDDYMVIFAKKNAADKVLIRNFAMDQNKIYVSNVSEKNLQSLTQLAYFFSAANWQNQEKNVLQKMLALDPHNCSTLSNLASILQREQNQTATMYLNQYQNFCQ